MEICLSCEELSECRESRIMSFFRRLLHNAARCFAVRSSLSSSENDAGGLSAQIGGEDKNAAAVRLMDSYGNSILRLAYSYLHSMADAEEILQDTLIKYIQYKPKVESSEHEKAWLLRVAANLSKNRIKYNGLRETDELSDTLAAEELEDLSFVWEAVGMLPEKYREVIHLFYYEGYSAERISKILKRNESTVRSDLRRGRERLKAVLKEEYDLE